MSETKSVPHLVAGFAGGLASAVTLQPFDLLKTRLQQKNTNAATGKHSLLSIIKEMPSWRNLWTGTLPSVLRTSVGSSLYLTSLSISRNYLAKRKQQQHQQQKITDAAVTMAAAPKVVSPQSQLATSKLPKLTMYENLIAGSVMRGLVGILTMPITVIKTRYESSIYNYTSLWRATVSIYREQNGFRGFFLGCGSTIVRDAPYAGLYVLMYEQFKVLLPKFMLTGSSSLSYHSQSSSIGNESQKRYPNTRPTSGLLSYQAVAVNSASAMLAASLATIMTTPFDTIKTRIQIDPVHYSNFLTASKLIIQKEGVKRLFTGAGLRLARKTFAAGIAWGIYEEILKVF